LKPRFGGFLKSLTHLPDTATIPVAVLSRVTARPASKQQHCYSFRGSGEPKRRILDPSVQL
jgi:hypothetical protein